MFEFWLRSSELVSTEELRCLVVVVVVVSVCAAQPAKQQSKRIPQYFVIVFITEAYPELSSSRKVSDVDARQSSTLAKRQPWRRIVTCDCRRIFPGSNAREFRAARKYSRSTS